jgi:hypothetical protein
MQTVGDPFIYLQFVRSVLLSLPGVTESLSHGTPGFYVQKKLLARLWENGEVLVVRIEDREKWLKANPEIYFITDHYKNYPTILVNLEKVDPEELKQLLIDAWMRRASKNLVKEYTK